MLMLKTQTASFGKAINRTVSETSHHWFTHWRIRSKTLSHSLNEFLTFHQNIFVYILTETSTQYAVCETIVLADVSRLYGEIALIAQNRASLSIQANQTRCPGLIGTTACNLGNKAMANHYPTNPSRRNHRSVQQARYLRAKFSCSGFHKRTTICH